MTEVPSATSGDPKSEKDEEPRDDASPAEKALVGELKSFTEAEKQVRDAAGWVIAAFAAIAGLLLTGIQLTALVHAEGSKHGWAIAAVALTVFGALVVITAHVSVLVSYLGNLRMVATSKATWRRVLVGDTNGHLQKTYETGLAPTIAAQLELTEANKAKVSTLNAFLGYFDSRFPPQSETISHEERVRLNVSMERIKGYLRLDAVRYRFRIARIWLVLGATLSAIGIVTFAQVTAAEDKPATTTAAPTAEANPARPVLIEANAGKTDELEALLGDGCVRSPLRALLITSAKDSAEVVTLPGGDCTPTRATVKLEDVSIRDACQVAIPSSTASSPSSSSSTTSLDPAQVREPVAWVSSGCG